MYLVELEVGFVFAAIVELEDQLAGLPGPRLVGLPHVGVLVGRGIVGEAALSGGLGLLYVVQGSIGIGGDRARAWVALGEDVEALIAAQLNFTGMALPALTVLNVGRSSTGLKKPPKS